jgi:hypothetical protein
MFIIFTRVFFAFSWGLSLIAYSWAAASSSGALDLAPFFLLIALNLIWVLPGPPMMKAFLRPHHEELASLRWRLQNPGHGTFMRTSTLRSEGIDSALAAATEDSTDELESVFALSGLKCAVVIGLGSAILYAALSYEWIPGLGDMYVRKSWLTIVAALVLPAIASSATAWLAARRFAEGHLNLV